MTEAALQATCIRWLRARGALCIKQSLQGRYGASGWPDYLVLHAKLPDRQWWIEFKAPKGRLTKLQATRIEQLRETGIGVSVLDNAAEMRRQWRELTR